MDERLLVAVLWLSMCVLGAHGSDRQREILMFGTVIMMATVALIGSGF